MLFHIVEQIKQNFNNLYDSFNYDGYDESNESNESIQARMKNLESKYNSRTSHPYKPHIFSLKSKKLLSYINNLTSLHDKIDFYNL